MGTDFARRALSLTVVMFALAFAGCAPRRVDEVTVPNGPKVIEVRAMYVLADAEADARLSRWLTSQTGQRPADQAAETDELAVYPEMLSWEQSLALAKSARKTKGATIVFSPRLVLRDGQRMCLVTGHGPCMDSDEKRVVSVPLQDNPAAAKVHVQRTWILDAQAQIAQDGRHVNLDLFPPLWVWTTCDKRLIPKGSKADSVWLVQTDAPRVGPTWPCTSVSVPDGKTLVIRHLLGSRHPVGVRWAPPSENGEVHKTAIVQTEANEQMPPMVLYVLLCPNIRNPADLPRDELHFGSGRGP